MLFSYEKGREIAPMLKFLCSKTTMLKLIKRKTSMIFFIFDFWPIITEIIRISKTKLYNVTKSLTPLPSHELPFSENPPVAKKELKALQYFFLHFPCHKGNSLSQSLDPLFVIPSYMTVLIFQRPKFQSLKQCFW